MQLKLSYYIATNVCSRISATTFGDLPDCILSLRITRLQLLLYLPGANELNLCQRQIYPTLKYLWISDPF